MTVEITRVDIGQSAGQVRRLVDRRLAAFLDQHAPPVTDHEVMAAHQLLRNFVLGGGKRIRPLLCYWGWRGAGGEDCEEIISAGTALELCHAGLLIHDDIMDSSDLRRGHPTMHRSLAALHRGGAARTFGTSAAILLGVLSLAWSDELMADVQVEHPRMRAARGLFDRMRTEVITGQYLDILTQVRDVSTIDHALTVIRYKTAKYTVERPLQIGGALAGADEALLDAYSRFGLPLGEAFQLRDDILGVFGDSATTGKSTIDDLREGKHTLLVAKAFELAGRAEATQLRTWLGNSELTDERAAGLKQIIANTGALAHVEKVIAERAHEALEALREAQIDPTARDALAALAGRLAQRNR